MIRLDLSSEARWIDLMPGLRLKVQPCTTSVMAAARRDPAVKALTGDAAEADPEALAIAVAKAVARSVVEDWEGVGDADGTPIPVSPEGLDALLENWKAFEAFQARYLAGYVLMDAEKNGSAPSPNGTSAGAETIAAPAPARAQTAPRS